MSRDDIDIERFKDELRNWLLSLAEAKVPTSALAFEVMASSYSAQIAGVPAEAFREALPFPVLRGPTVTLPAALVEQLVKAWLAYREAPSGTKFGEALGIEGRGQGKQPARAKIRQVQREARLGNPTTVERLTGAPSWEEAVARVAEATGASEKTVRRASEKLRARHIAELRRRGKIS